MKLENQMIKCECGSSMKPMKTTWKSILVRGWKCTKCSEELIHPVDAQKALELEKAKKNQSLKVKIRKVGKSNVITIPQTIMQLENLKNGQKVEWSIQGDQLIISI